MKSLPRLFAAFVLFAFALGVLAGCSGMHNNGGKTLSSIAVTPATPAHLKVGSTQQFTATGTFSDGTTSDISASVTWTSGTTATATISATGLATGVAAGTSSITASQGTVTSTPGVTLTVIALTSIAVTPNPASVAVSGTLQLTATGTYSDTSTADISSQVMWACAPSGVVTNFSASGLVTAGAANGTCQITATLGAVVSPAVTLTVGTGGTPVPVAVVIVQTNPTIAVGGVEDFTAQFKLSDGTLVAPTAAVTWSSGTTATATIIPALGIASGVAPGTSTITAASTGLTSGNTTLTVKTAVSRFAYVSGFIDIATANYVVNTPGATLTPFGVLRDTLVPAQVVPEPSGRFAYAIGANTSGAIGLYTVDSTTGALTNTNPGTGFSAGQTTPGPFQAITDPTGRFLYVANSNTNNITALQISNVDGSLSCLGTPAPPPPCTATGTGAGSFPVGLAEDRTGKFLYVANNVGQTISGFSVNPDGSLSALSPTATFPTGAAPFYPVIDPSNSFLYVPNNGDGTISIFSINSANGELTAVGTPVAVGSGPGSGPAQVVIDPTNKFLYVTLNGDNTVAGLTIGAGGTLGAAVPGSPFNAGSGPLGIAMDVSGAFLVAVNQNDNTISYYTLNANGSLTPGQTVGTRTSPQLVNLYVGTSAPTIAPATVEGANTGNGAGTGSVSSYTVDATTGALTTAVSSPKTTLDGNNQAAASTSGKFFYTASSSGKKLDGFTVDSSSAALTGLPSNSTNLSPAVPGGIFAETGDQFVYVADTANAAVVAFNNNVTLGLTTNSTLSGLTTVKAIAGDAQGTLIFALGAGQLQPILIDQGVGTITAPAALTLLQAGTWTAGAVDPSGRFLVAADSTGKQLSSFSIAPLGSGSDGTLTATGSTASLAGSGNYAVAIDPLGRFVFVADTTNGTVAVFTFNSSTGAITAPAAATVTVDATNGVTNVAVDANGKFLYVGTKGNGTPTPGTVAVYTIGSGGSLTPGTPVNAAIGTSAVTVTNSIN